MTKECSPQFFRNESLLALADNLVCFEPDLIAIYDAYIKSKRHIRAKQTNSPPPLEQLAGSIAEIIVHQYLEQWGKYHCVIHSPQSLRNSFKGIFRYNDQDVSGGVILNYGKPGKIELDDLLFYTSLEDGVIPLAVEVKQGVGNQAYSAVKNAMNKRSKKVMNRLSCFTDVTYMVVMLKDFDPLSTNMQTHADSQEAFIRKGGIIAFLPFSGQEIHELAVAMGKYIYGETLVVKS